MTRSEKIRATSLFCLAALALTGCVETALRSAPPPLPDAPETIAARVLASTLYVGTPYGGHGSGWALDASTIITAAHVVDAGVSEVSLRNGEKCTVQGIRISPDADIAAITVSECTLVPLPLRTEPVREGMPAHIAGHPRNNTWSFTTGTVSDTDGASDTDHGRLMLDVVAQLGNSGGPVVDSQGRVVGTLVSILADPIGVTWGGQSWAVDLPTIVDFVLTDPDLPVR